MPPNEPPNSTIRRPPHRVWRIVSISATIWAKVKGATSSDQP
nr:hypothetical protein [Gluconacetobacter liquefaciens]